MLFYVEIMDTYRRTNGRHHWIDHLLSSDGGKQKPAYNDDTITATGYDTTGNEIASYLLMKVTN